MVLSCTLYKALTVKHIPCKIHTNKNPKHEPKCINTAKKHKTNVCPALTITQSAFTLTEHVYVALALAITRK